METTVKNGMINKDSKYDTEEFDKVFIDTLRIVNAVGYPEATRQMNDDKEEILACLERKIHAEKALEHKRKTRFKSIYAAAVAIALSVIISTAYTAYRLGIRSGEQVSSQNKIEVTAPYGTIARIVLPDSSIVTLNGGSTLTYPALFGSERQVSLSGEGFFDIAKNNTTFTVNAAHISVKVLGTRFGFKAYDDDPYTVLTLEEGSIKAIPANESANKNILLKPEQQLVLNNGTGELRRRTVNTQEYTSWKDGVLTFRDVTWDEIATVLKRRFNVDIRIASDKIRNERYFALFKYGENIEQILDKLSYKRPWKYVKRENVIEIVEY
jgi:ferric-dicitrate binding protein FerR (iron transport regulator)